MEEINSPTLRTNNSKLVNRFYSFASFFLLALLFTGCGGSSNPQTEVANKPEPKPLRASDIDIKGEADGNRYFINRITRDTLFGGRRYYNVYSFKDGYCVVTQMVNGKELSGVINLKGEEVVPVKFEETIGNHESGGYFKIKNPDVGYIDTTGKIVIEPIYDGALWVKNGMVQLRKGFNQWGVLRMDGSVVVPFEYMHIGGFYDGMAVVKKNGKKGYVNTKGELVIPIEYDRAFGFENGLALVIKDNKVGFLNTSGEVAIPFEYEDIKMISDVVESPATLSGYENTNERFMMEEGYMILKKDGKWGYLNKEGKVVVPFDFEYVGVVSRNSDRLVVRNEGKQGSYNIKTGEVSWYSEEK